MLCLTTVTTVCSRIHDHRILAYFFTYLLHFLLGWWYSPWNVGTHCQLLRIWWPPWERIWRLSRKSRPNTFFTTLKIIICKTPIQRATRKTVIATSSKQTEWNSSMHATKRQQMFRRDKRLKTFGADDCHLSDTREQSIKARCTGQENTSLVQFPPLPDRSHFTNVRVFFNWSMRQAGCVMWLLHPKWKANLDDVWKADQNTGKEIKLL